MRVDDPYPNEAPGCVYAILLVGMIACVIILIMTVVLAFAYAIQWVA